MKAYILVPALAGALIIPGAASAFDWNSPNPDYEARQKSEQLHVSAGRAMAQGPRYDAGIPHAGRFSSARGGMNRYPDTRERVLRGTDY